jgi:hypothetical protein
MDTIYEKYEKYVKYMLVTGDIQSFKSNTEYTYMLEHVQHNSGKEYLNLIRAHSPISLDVVIDFCSKNDSIGAPIRYEFAFGDASPTSLRYLYHAHLILTHFKEVANGKPINIVEVGGGYGGLCLAISNVAHLYGLDIRSYSIVDLPTISKFQRLYLSHFVLNFSVEFYTSEQFGADIPGDNLFLISNYCFSELSAGLREKYVAALFPKVAHGFLAWNEIPVYDFGKVCEVEDEVPATGGPMNKYVRF